MTFISSDTNIWIDFSTIQELELPFLLPNTYLISSDTLSDELIDPADLGQRLVQLGLVTVEITESEYALILEYAKKYIQLSYYDRVALAIAKVRSIPLLTGDGLMRKVAVREGVEVMGTLRILDDLFLGSYINPDRYREVLLKLKKENGKKVRLPKAEIERRIQSLV
jgi:predicted nucleic acid-binding protein